MLVLAHDVVKTAIAFRQNFSTRSLGWRPAAGAGAARPLPATGHPSKESIQFDTRHNRFGVLSVASIGGFSATCFYSNPRRQAPVNEPHHVTMPAITEAVSS